MTIADFRSYIDAHQRAAEAYQDKKRWLAMSIINSANSGKFSTDRTMEEYNEQIWKLEKINPQY
jgi:starch phosphorylase